MSDSIENLNLEVLENIDLTGVDTNMPVIKDGTVLELVLVPEKTEVKASKTEGKEGNNNLFLNFKTTGVAVSDAGVELNPGFPLRDIVSLTKTPSYNPLTNLARIQEAILGEKQAGFKLSELFHKPFKAVVKVEDSTKYGKQNRIKYIPRDKQGN